MATSKTSVSALALAGVIATAGLFGATDGSRPSIAPSAYAQSGQLTSKRVTDAYFEATRLYDEENDVNGAAAVIQRVLSRDDLTPYERGIMLRTLANFQLELEQYPQAIRSLEGAVATGAFEETQLGELYFFLGGLYLANERFDDAIRALERYFGLAETPGASAYYLLAQAYAVKERWRDALQPSKTAIELSEDPNEGYLRLLVAVYINLGQWRNAVPLLETIITQFPGKDEYWQQLAAGYQELGREKDAYAIVELRYKLGFLTRSREFVTLADLHSFYGYPYKAAKLLEEELGRGRVERTAENYEKLGNYWLASREYEKAREALVEASRRAGSGRLDFQIAGTYAQDEDWRDAERYLLSALRRGGLTRSQQGNAWLLLGHSRNNLGKRRLALEAFKRAVRYPRAEKDASVWIEFLEEQFRIEAQNALVNAIQEVIDVAGRTRTAITDLEIIRDVAVQAKETAERARDATSDIARQRALDEYEIRNREATNRLQDQRSNAQNDQDAADEAAATARGFDELPQRDKDEIARLEALIIERLNLVTIAENNLREAADIIEELTGTRPATPTVPEEPVDMIPVPGTEEAEAGGAPAEAAPAEEGDAAPAEDGEEPAAAGGDGAEDTDTPQG
ncbi:MAG: tetratricopeptide repeat protein [Alphaproteobacteria bacterium]